MINKNRKYKIDPIQQISNRVVLAQIVIAFLAASVAIFTAYKK